MSDISHPAPQTPATPRDAATVVVLRDSGVKGIEVYLIKRSRAVDFMAGAHVFPGGRLDPADGSLEACAVRETFEEAGLRLDPAMLVPWVRWITPAISPKRFDARFFLARAPAGQEPKVDGYEATAKSIEVLAAYATVDAALAAAASRPPPVAMPVVWNDKEDGRAYISLPGDPRHPLPDVLGGAIRRFQLTEGRYRKVKAV